VTALRQLPLHQRHVGLGARFTEFAGWQMPLWYEGAVAEHGAVRRTAGVFDVSHMGRTWVMGNGAGGALASALSRDPGRLGAGESQYALACNERGGVVDDLLVYRLAAERFLVIGNAANAGRVRDLLAAACLGRDAEAEDAGEDSVLLAVQGPAARERLAAVLGQTVLGIARRACSEHVTGGATYFLSRTGYTGEDGFEVRTAVEAGGALLDRLLAGGVAPCGLAARDSLRLEAALPLHGADIDESTTPWEAGLGWAVELDHEFAGRAAVAAARESVDRRLACLVSDGEGVLRAGYPVRHRNEPVGSITSGGFSPMLHTSIAMAYLPRGLTAEGTVLSVVARGKEVPCRVVKRPFYRPPGVGG